MSHLLPATLSILPVLFFFLQSQVWDVFTFHPGKGLSLSRVLGLMCCSNNRCPQLYIGEACWAFLFGVIIGESAISVPVSYVRFEVAVPARAWHCTWFGQPTVSGVCDGQPPCRFDARLQTSYST